MKVMFLYDSVQIRDARYDGQQVEETGSMRARSVARGED